MNNARRKHLFWAIHWLGILLCSDEDGNLSPLDAAREYVEQALNEERQAHANRPDTFEWSSQSLLMQDNISLLETVLRNIDNIKRMISVRDMGMEEVQGLIRRTMRLISDTIGI